MPSIIVFLLYPLARCHMPAHFPLKLIGSRMLAPSVRHLSFVRDDGEPLDFIPGQFIQVHFNYPDGAATKRSYSIATLHDHAMGPGDALDIAVSFVPGGAASALACRFRAGPGVVGPASSLQPPPSTGPCPRNT